jgi:hypothetical protein
MDNNNQPEFVCVPLMYVTPTKLARKKENATAFINLVTMKTNRILHYSHNSSTMVSFWEKRRGMESFMCVRVFFKAT